MQNKYIKNIIFILIFFTSLFKGIYCQEVTSGLMKGDSLYNSKKYTEALKIYESELTSSGVTSPEKLIKMARIHEGSKNYAKALYYLALHYKIQKDNSVIPKTLSISKANQYNGWEFNDISFIRNLLTMHKKEIVVAFFSILTLLFILYGYNKIQNEKKNIVTLLFITLLCIVTIAFIEISNNTTYGIVLNNNSLIMDAPTAGSELIEVSTEGHKIEVLEQNDIWTKVKWANQTAYIRSSNLVVI